jgi:hypothetical protein
MTAHCRVARFGIYLRCLGGARLSMRTVHGTLRETRGSSLKIHLWNRVCPHQITASAFGRIHRGVSTSG